MTDLTIFDIILIAQEKGLAFVAVITDEMGNNHTFDSSNTTSWQKALEKIHGGPITSTEQIFQEEIKHGVRDELCYSNMTNEEINNWIRHYEEEISSLEEGDPYAHVYEEQIEQAIDVVNSRHETWFNPGETPVAQESACFCGWLGESQPLPEFKPPHCNCIVITFGDE